MKLKITVHGVAYEVDVEVLDLGEGFPGSSGHSRPRPRSRSNGESAALPPRPAAAAPSGAAGGAVTSPIAGTIIEIKCRAGDAVTRNQVLLVIEAMKMKTSIAAPTDGKIKAVSVNVGDNVQENQTLVEFE